MRAALFICDLIKVNLLPQILGKTFAAVSQLGNIIIIDRIGFYHSDLRDWIVIMNLESLIMLRPLRSNSNIFL